MEHGTNGPRHRIRSFRTPNRRLDAHRPDTSKAIRFAQREGQSPS